MEKNACFSIEDFLKKVILKESLLTSFGIRFFPGFVKTG